MSAQMADFLASVSFFQDELLESGLRNVLPKCNFQMSNNIIYFNSILYTFQTQFVQVHHSSN